MKSEIICAIGELTFPCFPGLSAVTRFIKGFEVPQKNATRKSKPRFIEKILEVHINLDAI